MKFKLLSVLILIGCVVLAAEENSLRFCGLKLGQKISKDIVPTSRTEMYYGYSFSPNETILQYNQYAFHASLLTRTITSVSAGFTTESRMAANELFVQTCRWLDQKYPNKKLEHYNKSNRRICVKFIDSADKTYYMIELNNPIESFYVVVFALYNTQLSELQKSEAENVLLVSNNEENVLYEYSANQVKDSVESADQKLFKRIAIQKANQASSKLYQQHIEQICTQDRESGNTRKKTESERSEAVEGEEEQLLDIHNPEADFFKALGCKAPDSLFAVGGKREIGFGEKLRKVLEAEIGKKYSISEAFWIYAVPFRRYIEKVEADARIALLEEIFDGIAFDDINSVSPRAIKEFGWTDGSKSPEEAKDRRLRSYYKLFGDDVYLVVNSDKYNELSADNKLKVLRPFAEEELRKIAEIKQSAQKILNNTRQSTCCKIGTFFVENICYVWISILMLIMIIWLKKKKGLRSVAKDEDCH